MKKDTQLRKQVAKGLRRFSEGDWIKDRMFRILAEGKTAFDHVMLEMGRMFSEVIMLMEREERTGPDYHPMDPCLAKWASQGGSVYIGDQKVRVEHPRMRDRVNRREVVLESYKKLQSAGGLFRGVT